MIISRPNVYLTSLTDVNNSLLTGLLAAYSNKRTSVLTIVDTPTDANFIIFAETGYFGWSDIAASFRTYCEFRNKYVFMINNTDWPYPVFDGFYPSLTKNYPGAFSWAYYLDKLPSPQIVERHKHGRKYLYSFVGRASTHPSRQKLLSLDRVDCPCIDIDNVPSNMRSFKYRETYNDIIDDSYSVLCPRGFGASSMRLFEVMRAGRAPVIVSDKWVAPPVGDWDGFSLKISESKISNIPYILKQHEHKAVELGIMARRVYDEYFSGDIYLERIIALYSENARTMSRNTLIKRALLRSGIRELRSFVKQVK